MEYTDSRAAQYNAWCRNNGIWKTASKNENWNQHLLWKPKMELALQWEILEEQIAMAFDSLDAEILIHIDDLKMNLQGEQYIVIPASNF